VLDGDLSRACALLFGPGHSLPADLHGESWQRRLRDAWRRRVLESHPDRAAVLGRDAADLEEEFRSLAEAYRILAQASRPGREDAPAAARPARREPPRPARPPVDHLHRGSVPRRPLLLAEFFYYAGRISWRNLVEAVAWQRGQRPSIGRIAVEWGHLSEDGVREVLAARRRADDPGAPFGEHALRLGLITSGQLLALLGRQRRLQKRIGEFFVERGILGTGEIAALEQELSAHNARFRRPATRVA
jgi:hypothetical protein